MIRKCSKRMERRLKKEKRKYSVRGHIIDNLLKCTFIDHGAGCISSLSDSVVYL